MPHRMILRLSKEEPVRLLSHLDMQAMLQRALRRCGLPVAYTRGFHPHAQVSFPLALGLRVHQRRGIRGHRKHPPGRPARVPAEAERSPAGGSASGALCVAQGEARNWRPDALPTIVSRPNPTALIMGTRAFMSKASVTARKAGKGGEQDVDIRAMVYAWKPEGKGVTVRLRADALSLSLRC